MRDQELSLRVLLKATKERLTTLPEKVARSSQASFLAPRDLCGLEGTLNSGGVEGGELMHAASLLGRVANADRSAKIVHMIYSLFSTAAMRCGGAGRRHISSAVRLLIQGDRARSLSIAMLKLGTRLNYR
jgi:hypothetical protein